MTTWMIEKVLRVLASELNNDATTAMYVEDVDGGHVEVELRDSGVSGAVWFAEDNELVVGPGRGDMMGIEVGHDNLTATVEHIIEVLEDVAM